jgi:hypothetical protein
MSCPLCEVGSCPLHDDDARAVDLSDLASTDAWAADDCASRGSEDNPLGFDPYD